MNKNTREVSCVFLKEYDSILPLSNNNEQLGHLFNVPVSTFIIHDLCTHMRMGISFTEEGENIIFSFPPIKPNISASFYQKIEEHIGGIENGMYKINIQGGYRTSSQFGSVHKRLTYNIEYLNK